MVRGLVGCLPGGEAAEVASPSFSLCNLYPTQPPVAHVDLYRVGMGTEPMTAAASSLPLTDEVLELVDNGGYLVLVEWSVFYPASCMPEKYIEVIWQQNEDPRQVEVTLHGSFDAISLEAWRHAFSIFDASRS